LTDDDAEDIFEYASNPEVSRFVGWEAHKTIQDSRDFLNKVLGKYANYEVAEWAVVYKQENKVIGTCGYLHWGFEQARAEIGYVLGREYWNQGLTTEAVREVIRFGFAAMQLNRIQAICEVDNIASGRVLEKAGMQLEGILRQYIQYKDKPLDMKMYSVIRP